MTDPRFDLGLYALPEAARLARMPRQTLANWVKGYRYPAGGRMVRAKPVVVSTVSEPATLSFVNLMEALVLAGFRKVGVPMQRVRRAVEYASRSAETTHLLASQRLLTDGRDLFWEFQERAKDPEPQLVNLSRGGQKAFPESRDAVSARDGVGS